MTSYLYFAMSVIMWDWLWFTRIPTWDWQERFILVLLVTPLIATDIYVIYEAFKKKNKTRV